MSQTVIYVVSVSTLKRMLNSFDSDKSFEGNVTLILQGVDFPLICIKMWVNRASSFSTLGT